MWGCIFSEARRDMKFIQILEQLGDECDLIVITENLMGKLTLYTVSDQDC